MYVQWRSEFNQYEVNIELLWVEVRQEKENAQDQ